MRKKTLKLIGFGAAVLFILLMFVPATSARAADTKTSKVFYANLKLALDQLVDNWEKRDSAGLIIIMEIKIDPIDNGWILTVIYIENPVPN